MPDIDYNDHHRHDGKANSDARISGVTSGNVLLNAMPNTEGGAGVTNLSWTITGATENGTYSAYGFDASGETMSQRLFDYDQGASATANQNWKAIRYAGAASNGCPMLCSMYMRLSGGSAGKVAFGFADGTDASFQAGHQATVDHSDLTAGSWVRVWARFDGTQSPAAGYPGNDTDFSTDTRFLVRCTEATTASEEILCTGFMAQMTLTGRLLPFQLCVVERIHVSNIFQTQDVPYLDQAVSMTNAVEITDLS